MATLVLSHVICFSDAPVMMAGGSAAPAAAAEEEEEEEDAPAAVQTSFALKLKAFDAAKKVRTLIFLFRNGQGTRGYTYSI